MKLLNITYEYPPIGGGGAAVAQGLASELADNGYKIDIVTSGMHDLPTHQIDNSVHIHRVNCRRKHRHYTSVFELATQVLPSYRTVLELTRQNNYDLNHTHFIFPSGLTAYMLWRKTGLPYVITAHGSDVPLYNPDRFEITHKLLHPVWQMIVANCEMIISPSNYLKGLIREYTDVPITVIPNGFNLSSVASKTTNKKNQILVATRMFERKGVQYFLDAIKNLDTDWEILIAGDGPYREILEKKAAAVRPRVQFLGFIDRALLFKLYQSAKIFVFASIQENFPTVLLEAMNGGCAIITASAEGCAEVVGNAGITVEAENTEQIRTALARLMADQQEIDRLGKLAMQRVEQFSWSAIAHRYDECFNQVLAARPCSTKQSCTATH